MLKCLCVLLSSVGADDRTSVFVRFADVLVRKRDKGEFIMSSLPNFLLAYLRSCHLSVYYTSLLLSVIFFVSVTIYSINFSSYLTLYIPLFSFLLLNPLHYFLLLFSFLSISLTHSFLYSFPSFPFTQLSTLFSFTTFFHLSFGCHFIRLFYSFS